MVVETVKVYKGKENVIVNKSDVELWNGNGYFTSSQQKKNAEEKKNGGGKEPTEAELKAAAEEKSKLEEEAGEKDKA